MSFCSENFWWVRIKGTVIVSIWWQLVFVIIYTGAVCYLYYYVPSIQVAYPSTLITILGVVVSLLLAFRTNNAYDRYWEGRKLWTTMTQDIRKLTRSIWLGVHRQSYLSKGLIERRTALNLCIGYVIAVKHYLRDEYSYDYDDLKNYVRHLPKFSIPSSNLSIQEQTLRVKKSKEKTKMAYDFTAPTNIPIEISYYLASYIKYLQENSLAEAWAISNIQSSLSNLVDCLCNFERILRTPIPLAYSIHLNHSVWLYILALPFQVVGDIGWFAIPCVGLGAFCLIGILSIGLEIENPFGYDDNDLPLDDFCEVIRLEIEMVMGMKIPDADEWIFSSENYPLGPENPNATELNNMSGEEVQELLTKIAQKHVLVDVGVTGGSGKNGKETKGSAKIKYGTIDTGYQQIG